MPDKVLRVHRGKGDYREYSIGELRKIASGKIKISAEEERELFLVYIKDLVKRMGNMLTPKNSVLVFEVNKKEEDDASGEQSP